MTTTEKEYIQASFENLGALLLEDSEALSYPALLRVIESRELLGRVLAGSHAAPLAPVPKRKNR